MTAALTVRFKNIASNKPRWIARAREYARRAKNKNPQALAFAELYNARRPVMTALLAARYKCVGYKRGKVLYLRRGGAWTTSSRMRKWDLGNGKHAIAVRLRHRATGQQVVLVVAHLSWQHRYSRQRHDEATRLLGYVARIWPGVPVVAVGDWNDARKPSKTRPRDTTGTVMKAHGLHDLETDVSAARRKNDHYNSANQNHRPPPTHSIHLDRAFGTDDVYATEWGLAVHGWPYDADHWSLDLTICIRKDHT